MTSTSVTRWIAFILVSLTVVGHAQQQIGIPVPPLGAGPFVLDTAEQMTRAIAFYESQGFVRDDAQKRGARCTRGYLRVL